MRCSEPDHRVQVTIARWPRLPQAIGGGFAAKRSLEKRPRDRTTSPAGARTLSPLSAAPPRFADAEAVQEFNHPNSRGNRPFPRASDQSLKLSSDRRSESQAKPVESASELLDGLCDATGATPRDLNQRMKMQITRTLITVAASCSLLANSANACTGITLKAKDGAVVFGRTMEWGSFDLHSRLVVVPRGHEYKSELPDGKHGLTWKTKYGAVGVDAVNKDLIADGMNEKGLCVNVFYHPGYAEYPAFDPAQSATTIGSLDVCQYLAHHLLLH